MSECPICLDKINDEFAVINNLGETGKYHPNCLQSWLGKSSNGILTNNIVETYSIYNDDKYINTLSINHDPYHEVIILNDDPFSIPIENEFTHNDSSSCNSDFYCYGRIIAITAFIIITCYIIYWLYTYMTKKS